MKATIYSHETIIGTAELQIGDEHMGGVYGQFTPTEYYFRNIQKAVWEFWSSEKRDFKTWNSFRFNTKLDNGFFIPSFSSFTIEDFQGFPDDPKVIEIAGIDLNILKLSDDFILEPWYQVGIKQKLALENELHKEIGPNLTFWGFFKSKQNHILLDAKVSLFAKYGPNDDALFAINQKGNENKFAVVHLTWSQKQEEHINCPSTTLYFSLNDFIEKRMKPDSEEWREWN